MPLWLRPPRVTHLGTCRSSNACPPEQQPWLDDRRCGCIRHGDPHPVRGPDGHRPRHGASAWEWLGPLGVGQQIWYAFQYAGDDSQILVDMQAKPGNGATFSIWTPADVANWAAGNKPDPVGHGSSDITSTGVTWSGRGISTSPAPITSSSTRPVRP